MKTTYVGQEKLIVHGNRLFTMDAAKHVSDLEWAETILSRPNCTYSNGRDSHECANEVIDRAEDALIEHQRWVA